MRSGGERTYGWLLVPPVSKAKAVEEFGHDIPEPIWSEICHAFKRHGFRLDQVEASRDNRNPNDKRSWGKQINDGRKGIEAALSGLAKIKPKFLDEVEDNVSTKLSDSISKKGARERLRNAQDELMFLSWLFEVAEPLSQELVSKAASRKMLACEIFAILKPIGAEISNGWKLSQQNTSYADLTGFERLVELLEIHQGETPIATAKWLRSALAQNK